MYKAKFQIWLGLLAASLIIFFISKIDFSSVVYTVFSPLEQDFSKRFGYVDKSGIELDTIETNDADIIVKLASDEKIDGYQEYRNQFSSDLYIYLNTSKYCNDNCGFIDDMEKETNSFLDIKNLKLLLEAIEQNKTFGDIGLTDIDNEHHDNEKLINPKNKIKLFLPNKSVYYYENVRLLIAYALNDYSYNNINDETLQKRVDNIFDKCQQYYSDTEVSTRIFGETTMDNRSLYIAPSYIKDKAIISKNNNRGYYCFISFSPLKTISIKYDMYLKNDIDYTELLDILKTRSFFRDTGLKNIKRDFSISKSYN